MNRSSFLTTGIGGLALTACAGGVTLPRVGAKQVTKNGVAHWNPELPALMSKAGILGFTAGGVTYDHRGIIIGSCPQPPRGPIRSCDGTPAPDSIHTIGYVNVYGTNTDPLGMNFWTTGPFYGYAATNNNVTYRAHPVLVRCRDQILASAGWAWKAYQYIKANASKFSTGVINANAAFGAKYAAGGLTAGAAAEWLGGLGAICGVDEWITLLGGIAVGVVFIYDLVVCVGNMG